MKTKLTCAIVLAALLAGGIGGAVPAAAMQQQSAAARTVTGHVVNKGGGALPGAVVYLKDTKTLAVKSFIAADAGSFHFGQLAQASDYTVWAEFQGKHSNTKKISSFDNHNSFDFTLEIAN